MIGKTPAWTEKGPVLRGRLEEVARHFDVLVLEVVDAHLEDSEAPNHEAVLEGP